MLILSRKKGESIMLGDNIEVTVLGVDGGRVSLGLKAPKEMEILRKELYEQVESENISAVNKNATFDDFKNLF